MTQEPYAPAATAQASERLSVDTPKTSVRDTLKYVCVELAGDKVPNGTAVPPRNRCLNAARPRYIPAKIPTDGRSACRASGLLEIPMY